MILYKAYAKAQCMKTYFNQLRLKNSYVSYRRPKGRKATKEVEEEEGQERSKEAHERLFLLSVSKKRASEERVAEFRSQRHH